MTELQSDENIKYQLNVLRLVLIALVETHPDRQALARCLKTTFERVISNSIASPRATDKMLNALPLDLQKWLDVIKSIGQPGVPGL